jgi:hypothetical protein
LENVPWDNSLVRWMWKYIGDLVGKQGTGPFQRFVSDPPVFLYEKNHSHPIIFEGKVLRGYQRGRQLLGCPTANLSVEPYQQLLQSLDCGIYFGWAKLEKFVCYNSL